MKRRYILLLVLLPVAFMTFSGFTMNNSKTIADFSFEPSLFDVPSIEEVRSDFPGGHNSLTLGKTYLGFKEALAFSESSGNYFAVNRLGYKGRYQLGKSALKWVGVKSSKQFMKSPLLQEAAFDALVAKNKFVLRNHIATYNGKIIGGVKVTESGLIAAAHLCGAGNVKKFLETNGKYIFADANNVPLTKYLNHFKDFDTSTVPANANATVS